MRNICRIKKYTYLCTVLKKQRLLKINMVNVAQLVRALDCGSKGRGFEPHLSPRKRKDLRKKILFCLYLFVCFLLPSFIFS